MSDTRGMSGGDARDPAPRRIVDSAATVMSTNPRWGYLRVSTETGDVEFRMTANCAENLIVDLKKFLTTE